MKKYLNKLEGMMSRVKPIFIGLLIEVTATAIVTMRKPRRCAGLSIF